MARRVTFNEDGARRIVDTVRAYERGNRDQDPVKFRTPGDDSALEVRLGMALADIDKGSAGDVQLYDNDGEDPGSGECDPGAFTPADEVVCAQNLIGDVKAESWVYLLKPAGGQSWHIVATNDQPQNTPDACGKRTEDLIELSVEGCHGSGAMAVAHVTGDCPGPITSVDITHGGSGYAVRGRYEPMMTVTGSGDGATFIAEMASVDGDCDIPHWEIQEVAIVGSGLNYKDGEKLSVSVGLGGVEVEKAVLTLVTSKSPPTLTAIGVGGSGAILSVSTTTSGGAWTVSGVTVSSGGSGYYDGRALMFSTAEGDVQDSPAVATVTTLRSAPTLTAIANGGSGAVLSISLSSDVNELGRPIWGVASITPTIAGAGYTAGARVRIVCTAGTTVVTSKATVSTVDETGGITAVNVSQSGVYYHDAGEIDSVTVTSGGSYYHEVPDSVTVDSGGNYYQDNNTASPYVDTTTVTLTQESPSAGSGATFEAVIDDDPSSLTFGTITGITVTDGGDGYFDRKNVYDSTWAGMKFSDVPGYDGSKTQILGHDPGGCLSWFNVTTCEADTSGVCCISGEIDESKTTEAACQAAGGTWHPGPVSEDLPGPCCP